MATESFALHNLGSDTLPVIRDTHCCHATMVNLKGPFASVTRQEWHTECQTSPGHHGENTTFEQRRKNISPIFLPYKKVFFWTSKSKEGHNQHGDHAWSQHQGSSTWPEKNPHHLLWGCRVQDLALAVSLVQSTAVHKMLIYNFWDLLAASRPKIPPHNQASYCGVSGSSSLLWRFPNFL